VYKEKAYEIFLEMLGNINYKVVRGVLSATSATQVQRVKLNLDQLNDMIKAQKLPLDHPLIQQISSDLQQKHGKTLQKNDDGGGVRVVDA